MKISGISPLRQATPLKTPTRPSVDQAPATPPSDLVELRASRVSRAGLASLAVLGVMGAAVTAAVLLAPGPALTVGQLGSALHPQTAQQDRDSSMRFEVLPNAAGKIDLVRQQDSEDDGDGGSRSVDRQLSPLGVYLGDGVFLDSNMNLSFVPSRVVQGPVLEPAQSLEVRGAIRADVSQQGDTTTIQRFGPDQSVRQLGADRVEFRPGSWSSPVQISRSGDTTTIEGGAFSYPVTITRSENQITVRQSGLFGSSSSTVISRSDHQFEMTRGSLFGGKVNVSVNGMGQVEYQGRGVSDTLVQRGENGIVTVRGGWGSSQSTLDLRGDSVRETGPDGQFQYQIRR